MLTETKKPNQLAKQNQQMNAISQRIGPTTKQEHVGYKHLTQINRLQGNPRHHINHNMHPETSVYWK